MNDSSQPSFARRLGPLAIALLAVMSAPVRGANSHFVAELSDGARVEADSVAEWGVPETPPHLNGRKIFDGTNPFRWLINDALSLPADAPSFIEFFGGDRFPGKIELFVPGDGNPHAQSPDSLILTALVDVHPPGTDRLPLLRVSTEWIRRVVWRRTGRDVWQPGTLFLNDGREMKFRSFRWADGKLTLLEAGKITTVAWNDIAELHLPARDEWDAYYHQLALLSPDAASPLIQLESTGGLTATTSLLQFQPFSSGDRKKPENWYQIVQPFWSLDPIWIRFEQIRSWKFFKPHQVPLSRFVPSRIEQRSAFGSGWRYRADRNVHGSALRVNDQLFGWGLGVHGACELTFALPAAAKVFRTRAGLDQSVGGGGCARGLISLGEASPPLFTGEALIGCKKVVDSGRINLPQGGDGLRTLTLAVDSLPQERPAGADPFDVRDTFNWLEPEVELDPAQLQLEVQQRLFSSIAPLAQWRFAAPTPALQLETQWDKWDSESSRYARYWKVMKPFQQVQRELTIAREQRWLVFFVERPNDKAGHCSLHVRIDGRVIADVPVPARTSSLDPDPLAIPVDEFQGRTVPVEVALIPDEDAALVEWRGVSLFQHLPGVLPLFDENRNLAGQVRGGAGELLFEQGDAFSGTGALRLSGPDRFQASISGWMAPVRERPQSGEFRFLQFAWKGPGADQITLGLGHDGELGSEARRAIQPRVFKLTTGWRRPQRFEGDEKGRKVGFRYDAGMSEFELTPVLRLSRSVPEEWTLVTRDLADDFGSFHLTGLSFHCPAGQTVAFDHIYLCRTQNDVRLLAREIAARQSPNQSPTRAAQPADCTTIIARIAPQFSSLTLDEGISLEAEYRGRKQVAVTSPFGENKPWRLRSPLIVPAGKQTFLEAEVSHRDEGEWQLVVLANGTKLQESAISPQTAPDGWTKVSVDLTRFAGQPILLEVQNNAPKWNSRQQAYWSRLEVLSK